METTWFALTVRYKCASIKKGLHLSLIVTITTTWPDNSIFFGSNFVKENILEGFDTEKKDLLEEIF